MVAMPLARTARIAFALLLLPVMLSGCAGPLLPPVDDDEPVVLPTGTVLVASWTRFGGEGGMSGSIIDPPEVAIYSDGQIITEASRVWTVPPEQVQGIVDLFRRKLGGLPASPVPDTGSDLSDGRTSRFRWLAADGQMREVTAYGVQQLPGYPDELVDVEQSMADFAVEVYDDGDEYTSAGVRLVAAPVSRHDLYPRWPAAVKLPTTPGRTALGYEDPHHPMADLTGDAAATVVRELAEAEYDGRAENGGENYRLSNGTTVHAAWRYLLPDELLAG
jgi:hypothetical protein